MVGDSGLNPSWNLTLQIFVGYDALGQNAKDKLGQLASIGNDLDALNELSN